jgi:WD40 repeat protein
MVALPGDDDTVAIVRDLRMSGESQPVARLYGATDPPKHGMVQSLAYCTDASGQDILACGMESGHVFFHDLTMSSTLSSRGSCSVALCRDPILSLDMVPSSHHHDTVIAIAGMAANRSDLLDLAPEDRGTVAFIKTVRLYNDTLEATVRVRRNTCTIDDSVTATGKPGAAICRFRPDGRMFAVGGWDKRLRIFDSKGSVNPLAILRGHAESVYAMDWSLDSSVSGIMATGAPDGRINVWRCFSKTQAESSLLTS